MKSLQNPARLCLLILSLFLAQALPAQSPTPDQVEKEWDWPAMEQYLEDYVANHSNANHKLVAQTIRDHLAEEHALDAARILMKTGVEMNILVGSNVVYTDPVAIIRWLEETPEDEWTDGMDELCFAFSAPAEMMTTDLEKTLALISTPPQASRRSSSVRTNAIYSLTHADPELVLIFLQKPETQSLPHYQALIEDVIRALPTLDKVPDTAIQFLLQLQAKGQLKPDYAEKILYMVKQLARENEQAAWDFVGKLENDDLKTAAMSGLISTLLESSEDISTALLYLDQLPRGEAYQQRLAQAANYYYARNSKEALQWARDLEHPEDLLIVIPAIIRTGGPTELTGEVVELIGKIEDSDEKSMLISALIEQRLGKNDPPRMRRLEREVGRDNAEAAANVQAHHRAKWVFEPLLKALQAIEDEELRRTSLEELTLAAAEYLPEQCFDLALSLDPSGENLTVHSVVVNWARSDADAVAVRLNSLEASPLRDGAVTAFANVLQETDPAGAVAWVQTLQDAEMRQFHLQWLLEQWVENYPEEARRWISNSDLDPELKRQFLNSKVTKPLPF